MKELGELLGKMSLDVDKQKHLTKSLMIGQALLLIYILIFARSTKLET